MISNGTATTGTNATGTPTGTPTGTSTRTPTGSPAAGMPEQLNLLNAPSVPLQFRLDERTRRSGLQHVAELRALMLAQATGRRTVASPTRHADRHRHNQAA